MSRSAIVDEERRTAEQLRRARRRVEESRQLIEVSRRHRDESIDRIMSLMRGRRRPAGWRES
jgi:hypothetical protein